MKSSGFLKDSVMSQRSKQQNTTPLNVEQKTSACWSVEGEKQSLLLFKRAAESVPAYKDFLKKHAVDPKKIRTWKDFQAITPISKKNYLRRYPLEAICWDGHLKKPLVFTSTSGSTGVPFYFPRGHQLDWQQSLLNEEFLHNSGIGKNEPTLVIIGFGMGVWIGGLINYQAFEMIAQRTGAALSIITPGINKKEIFNALKNLAPHYEHVVLVGYPPFIKDIIDEASLEGISLKKLDLKLIFAAEAFTETFRDYLVKKAGIKNPCTDTMNIYGTADIGAMAYETPLSIFIRRLTMKKPELFADIFGNISKTPTLAQFNPQFINFESVSGSLIITGNNEIPLIRYELGDRGGVYPHDQMNECLRKHGIDMAREMKIAGMGHLLNELPFVFVFERDDLSLTLYGLQIYPESIRETILEDLFSEYLTGKFLMFTKFDRRQNQYLEINFELKKGVARVSPAFKKQLLKKIMTALRHKNSEFRELSDYLGKRAHPKLIFLPAESPEYFKPGIKQKWVAK